MQDKISELKKTARLAGLLYLIVVLTSIYAHMYVPARIFVTGDVAATANNILSNELLFRSCIIVGLIETTAFLLLGLTFYRLFKDTNNHQAKLMVSLVAVQVPLALVFAVFKFMALTIVRNDISGTIQPGELPGVAIMFLNIIRYGSTVLGVFAGLWLVPLGMLIFRSRFFPQSLGILVMIAGAGSVLYGLIAVLIPGYNQSPLPAFIFFALGEIPVMLWLLIKGVKDHISIPAILKVEASLEERLQL